MKKFLVSIIAIISLLISPTVISAQSPTQQPTDSYFKAKVIEILDEGEDNVNGVSIPYQRVRVEFLDTKLSGKTTIIDHGKIFSITKNKFVQEGNHIVVLHGPGPDGTPVYQIIDTYRLPTLLPFIIAFVALVILLSRWRGFGSIVGLGISFFVITYYIVPNILSGGDPFITSIVGCLFIMVVTMYMAHGFTKQTSLSIFSTLVTLVFVGIVSTILVKLMALTGVGSEEAFSLKLGPTANINLKGLLLGGIIIGSLGVLDDITTSLTAAIFELHKANPKLKFSHLWSAGLRIGREHITSLVNTLALAYAGASLPLFILLIVNPNNYPLWVIVNTEPIMEEVVRTLSGSFGLVAAVPFTAFLTSWYLRGKQSPVAGK